MNSSLDGAKQTLDRRVPTRWNSDFTCLQAHLYFRVEVDRLTRNPSNNLGRYRLSDKQWQLTEDLVDALTVCIILSQWLCCT